MPDGFLPPGMLADPLYGQVHFDEALGIIGWIHHFHALLEIVKYASLFPAFSEIDLDLMDPI